MSWRRIALRGSIVPLLFCVLGAGAAEPCTPGPQAGPRELHLGDGTTSYDYYPIIDFLRDNPASESETLKEERLEQAATKSPNTLKPPSADIVESEFSHLLGAIARDNGGIGAAVFDTTGLKVGAAGLELEGLALTPERLAQLRKAPEDPPVEARYSCTQLSELSRTCAKSAIYGPPCYPLTDFVKSCKAPVTVYYRPVIDYGAHIRQVGFSMLVAQDRLCGGAARGR